MPNIKILERDMTKASFQISPTDMVFVPGFSVRDDATLDLTYCEFISKFEEKFGTCPRLLYETVVKTNVDNLETSINLTTYTATHKTGIKLTYKYIKTVQNDQDEDVDIYDWTYNYKGRDIWINDDEHNNNLEDVYGITYSPNDHEFSVGDFLEVIPVFDQSYVYAKELLMAGLPIIYKVMETEPVIGSTDEYSKYSAEAMSEALKTSTLYDYNDSEGLMDKGEFSIKYVTSGFYPSFIYEYNSEDDPLIVDEDDRYDFSKSFCQKMLDLAGHRGDCVSLIDPTPYEAGALPFIFTDEEDRILGEEYDISYISEIENFSYLGNGSLWKAAQVFADNAPYLEYGAMFAPWAFYYTQASYYVEDTKEKITDLAKVVMPPSFGYLITLAKSIRTNNNWLAVAGIARGQVPYFAGAYTLERLSNNTANEMQPRNGKTSINAITNIKPYGYTIWGNRTMKNNEDEAMGGEDGLTATSFLNIRNMVSDVKKTAYNAAKQCMFEQNSDVLWVNFCSLITPLLDRLMSGQGLSNYKILKRETDEKAKLKATIILYPIYAVEDFEITIELRDEDVSVV